MENQAKARTSDASRPLKKLRYDEIQVGDRIPLFTKWITAESGIKQGRLYGDFYSGHVSQRGSQDQFGVATTAIQGVLTLQGFTPCLMNWLRSAKPLICGGKLEDFRCLLLVVPGDTLVYSGKVKSKEEVGGKKYVVCEMSGENQRGDIFATGTARLCFGEED